MNKKFLEDNKEYFYKNILYYLKKNKNEILFISDLLIYEMVLDLLQEQFEYIPKNVSITELSTYIFKKINIKEIPKIKI